MIRFQQGGIYDFTQSYIDGFLIDEVKVTGIQDPGAPVITGFSPGEGYAGTEVVVTGRNFTPGSVVRLNNVSAGEVTFVDAERLRFLVPALAGTGRITVETESGRAVSATDFRVLGRETIFFEDWESGELRSMWRAGSSTSDGLVTVAQSVSGTPAAANGFYGAALGKWQDGSYTQNVNTLDLHIPLAAYAGRDLTLSFLTRDFGDRTDAEVGLWLSDDGGVTFRKAWRFDPE